MFSQVEENYLKAIYTLEEKKIAIKQLVTYKKHQDVPLKKTTCFVKQKI